MLSDSILHLVEIHSLFQGAGVCMGWNSPSLLKKSSKRWEVNLEIVMGWTVSPRSKFVCWSLTPTPYLRKWLSLETESLKKSWRENEALGENLGFLKRRNLDTQRHQGSTHGGKSTWGHRKKVPTYKPKREALEETKLTDTPILGFWAPELWKKKLWVIKVPNLCYFITADLAH